MPDREDIGHDIGEFIASLPGYIGCLSALVFYAYLIVLVPVFLTASLSLPRLSTFSCIRHKSSQFSCELISSSLLGTHTTHIPSGQLQLAEVEKRCEGEDCRDEVTLKTTRGKISLIDNSNPQEKVDEINLFIKNDKQKTLMFRRDDRWQIIYTVIIWGAFFSVTYYRKIISWFD